jgi:hypothetical protein
MAKAYLDYKIYRIIVMPIPLCGTVCWSLTIEQMIRMERVKFFASEWPWGVE